MPFYLWVTSNVIFIISSFLYIWIINPHPSLLVKTGQLFAQIAIVLFLLNVNMYFIFLVIRRVKKRKLTVKLAKLSRKLMKTHVYTGLIGASLIVIHGAIMLTTLGEVISFTHIKMVTGYLSIILLFITLFAGYLRRKKSSGFRRKFHQSSALIFCLIFVIHLFLPS